jgi:hypothetical protein
MALDGGLVVTVTPRPRFTPGERTSVPIEQEAQWAPRDGLDTEVTRKILSPLPGIEPRSRCRPVRTQTLYWLSYPGSLDNKIKKGKAVPLHAMEALGRRGDIPTLINWQPWSNKRLFLWHFISTKSERYIVPTALNQYNIITHIVKERLLVYCHASTNAYVCTRNRLQASQHWLVCVTFYFYVFAKLFHGIQFQD